MPPPDPLTQHRYLWATLAVLLVVAAMVGGVWLLSIQTRDLKHAAQNAACVSIANQNLQYRLTTGRRPPVPTRLICDGRTEREIIFAAKQASKPRR